MFIKCPSPPRKSTGDRGFVRCSSFSESAKALLELLILIKYSGQGKLFESKAVPLSRLKVSPPGFISYIVLGRRKYEAGIEILAGKLWTECFYGMCTFKRVSCDR